MSDFVRKVSACARKVLDGVRKVLDGIGKVSDGVGKVSYGIRKMSDGARKLSDGVKNCPEYILPSSGAPKVYFKRLLPRPEYILRLLAGGQCETYGN